MLPLLIAAALTAQAENIAVTWDAEPVRYHAESMVSTPRGQLWIGKANVEARAYRVDTVADLTCAGAPIRKLTRVTCTLDTIMFHGLPYKGDEEKLERIMAEYKEMMTGAQLEIDIAEDGRIRALDLEGVSKDSLRESLIQEYLRQLMRKLVAPLDVITPKDGVDPGAAWKYKGYPIGYELLSRTGTAGKVALEFRTDEGRNGHAMLVAEGGGNVATNADADQGAQAGVNMVGGGQYLIDAASSEVAYGEFTVSGELSARASGALTNPAFYGLGGWVGRINADGTIETFDGPVTAADAAPTERPDGE